MTVEITIPLALGLFSALSSMLLATWALSRRSRDWDKAEQLEIIVVLGDPKTGKKSIIRELEELHTHTLPEMRDAIGECVRQLKILKTALNAHGSDEHIVIEAVERVIQSAARSAAGDEYERRRREAQRVRQLVIDEQNERLGFPRQLPNPPIAPRTRAPFEQLGESETPEPPSDEPEPPKRRR